MPPGSFSRYLVADENYFKNIWYSFTNVEKWMKQVNENGAEKVVKMLVANKCDVGTETE